MMKQIVLMLLLLLLLDIHMISALNTLKYNQFLFHDGVEIEDTHDTGVLPAHIPVDIDYKKYNMYRASFVGAKIGTVNIQLTPQENNDKNKNSETLKVIVRGVERERLDVPPDKRFFGLDGIKKLANWDKNDTTRKGHNIQNIFTYVQVGRGPYLPSIWIKHFKEVDNMGIGAYESLDWSLEPANPHSLAFIGKDESETGNYAQFNFANNALTVNSAFNCVGIGLKGGCVEKDTVTIGGNVSLGQLFGTVGIAGAVDKSNSIKRDAKKEWTYFDRQKIVNGHGEVPSCSGCLKSFPENTDKSPNPIGQGGRYDLAYILYLSVYANSDKDLQYKIVIRNDNKKNCEIDTLEDEKDIESNIVGFDFQKKWNKYASFTMLAAEEKKMLTDKDRWLVLCGAWGFGKGGDSDGSKTSEIKSWGGVVYAIPNGN